MLPVLNNLKSLQVGRALRLVWCWKIIRTDGVILRLTEHNGKLDVNGETYYPAIFNNSALQKQVGMKERNLEIVGAISSDYITETDLHAGRYDNAKFEARLVDWRYPFAGVFDTRVFWIDTTQFDGEKFNGQVVGLSNRMNNDVGQVISRTCYKTLGAADCHVDLIPFTLTKTVTAVDNLRNSLRANFAGATNPLTAAAIADDYFNDGSITWLTGNNAGLKSEVLDFTVATGKLDLFLDTPFDIQVGDTFTIYPGCDLLFSTCKAKYLNGINFGGDPDVPGNDAINHPQGAP